MNESYIIFDCDMSVVPQNAQKLKPFQNSVNHTHTHFSSHPTIFPTHTPMKHHFSFFNDFFRLRQKKT